MAHSILCLSPWRSSLTSRDVLTITSDPEWGNTLGILSGSSFWSKAPSLCMGINTERFNLVYHVVKCVVMGVRGGAGGWGTAVRTGRLRVPFPVGSLRFFISLFFRPHCGSGIDSACNRNEYQGPIVGGKGGRCLRMTTLPPSYTDCQKFWELQPSGFLTSYPSLYRDRFTVVFCNFKPHVLCL
jgi:hypothetical protein